MKRRQFIALLSGTTLSWPLATRAQQRPTMLRVGIVTIQPRKSPPYVAFDQRLGELGYIEGQNLAVEFRVACHDLGGLLFRSRPAR